jgi:hypothetical protein
MDAFLFTCAFVWHVVGILHAGGNKKLIFPERRAQPHCRLQDIVQELRLRDTCTS